MLVYEDWTIQIVLNQWCCPLENMMSWIYVRPQFHFMSIVVILLDAIVPILISSNI